MSQLLDALRAAVRPQTPPVGVGHQSHPFGGLPGAPRRLSVGPWLPPATAGGSWGPLAPGSNHPHEGDAIVSLVESTPNRETFTPVALLRRRLHPVQAGDPDAHHLQPVALFELLSPNGRDYLSSTNAETLLEELASRIGNCSAMRRDG